MPGNKNHIAKLPHAPLQEVIFELRWKLDFDPATQNEADKDFQFAFAKFNHFTSAGFRHNAILKPAIVPENFFNYRPVYQFWANENIYPVYQLGPGVFTVNETDKNYEWAYFKNLVLQGIEWLKNSYSRKLEFSFVELRYIDTIEINDNTNIETFLSQHLNITINNPVIENSLTDIQLHQRFKIDRENSLSLLITNGTKNSNQSKIIILQTSFNRTSGIFLEDLTPWIDAAHKKCSSLFKQMISKDLYERFSKAD